MADSFMRQLIASLARRTPVLDEEAPYGRSSGTREQSSRLTSPVLLREDWPDFERTLDDALRADIPSGTEPLNAEQLRMMALTAYEAIAARAEPEYAAYVEAREQIGRQGEVGGAIGIRIGDAAERRGASTAAVVAVLAPVLFGSAAAVFLIVGYVLKILNPAVALSQSLVTGGWIFGAATAASVLAAGVGLLLTVLREASPQEEWAGSEEVTAAREAWQRALRTRGIEPFLRDVRKAVSTNLDLDQAP